jgi:uncharacterized membrane protein YgcG
MMVVIMVMIMIVVMVMMLMVIVMIVMVMMIIMIVVIVMYVWSHMTRQTGWGIGVVMAVTGIISRDRSRGDHQAAETNSGGGSESNYDFMKHEGFLQDEYA